MSNHFKICWVKKLYDRQVAKQFFTNWRVQNVGYKYNYQNTHSLFGHFNFPILLSRLITKQVNPCLTFENHCICQQPSLIDACTLWWFLAIQKHNVSFSWPHNMSSFSVTSLSFCWFPFTQRVLNKTHVYHEVPESMRLESFSIRLA